MIELTDSSAEVIAERFGALAEPMRLRLLNALRRGEKSVGELAEESGAGQANTKPCTCTIAPAGFIERRKGRDDELVPGGRPCGVRTRSLISVGIDRSSNAAVNSSVTGVSLSPLGWPRSPAMSGVIMRPSGYRPPLLADRFYRRRNSQ